MLKRKSEPSKSHFQRFMFGWKLVVFCVLINNICSAANTITQLKEIVNTFYDFNPKSVAKQIGQIIYLFIWSIE